MISGLSCSGRASRSPLVYRRSARPGPSRPAPPRALRRRRARNLGHLERRAPRPGIVLGDLARGPNRSPRRPLRWSPRSPPHWSRRSPFVAPPGAAPGLAHRAGDRRATPRRADSLRGEGPPVPSRAEFRPLREEDQNVAVDTFDAELADGRAHLRFERAARRAHSGSEPRLRIDAPRWSPPAHRGSRHRKSVERGRHHDQLEIGARRRAQTREQRQRKVPCR